MNFEGQPEAGDLTNRIEQVGPAIGCRCWGWIRTGLLDCDRLPGPSLQRASLKQWRTPLRLQVTLFRVHKHFITPEAHYWRQKYKLGDSAGGREA